MKWKRKNRGYKNSVGSKVIKSLILCYEVVFIVTSTDCSQGVGQTTVITVSGRSEFNKE